MWHHTHQVMSTTTDLQQLRRILNKKELQQKWINQYVHQQNIQTKGVGRLQHQYIINQSINQSVFVYIAPNHN